MLVDKSLVDASTTRASQDIRKTRTDHARQALGFGRPPRTGPTPRPHLAYPNLTVEGDTPSDLDLERIIGTNDLLLDLNWLERGQRSHLTNLAGVFQYNHSTR
jgi:hypothetical protein